MKLHVQENQTFNMEGMPKGQTGTAYFYADETVAEEREHIVSGATMGIVLNNNNHVIAEIHADRCEAFEMGDVAGRGLLFRVISNEALVLHPQPDMPRLRDYLNAHSHELRRELLGELRGVAASTGYGTRSFAGRPTNGGGVIR